MPTGRFKEFADQVASIVGDSAKADELTAIFEEHIPGEVAMIEKVGPSGRLSPFVSAFAGMEQADYAWPINGHFNAHGYRILADVVYDEVLRSDSTFFYRY